MKLTTEFDTPWAYSDKILMIKTGEWKYQRPVVAASKCCRCGVCSLFCPVGCVSDTGSHFEANLDYCKGCGICARVCPVDVIEMVREA